MKSIGRLKEDPYYYYRANRERPAFPRILIKFHKKQHIEDLEFEANPEQHNLYKRFFKKFKQNINVHKAKMYFHTINNITISQFKEAFPDASNTVKPLYEKVLGDPYLNQHDVMAWAKSKTTLFAAAKRQIKTAPTPDSQVVSDFIQYAKNKVDREVGYYLEHFGYSYQDWYDHLPTKKQKLIDEVHALLNGDNYLDMDSKKIKQTLSTNYQAICKTEIQDPDGKPRMVCSIPQIIKYTMGPVTWHLEEIFEKHYNGYCGSMNLTQMAHKLNAYIDDGFTKVVEGDGSAFDNSQDIMLKELDRYIYNKVSHAVYHVSKQQFKEISNQYYKTMKVKYSERKHMKTLFKYHVLGTVFSGDCDTTLANTIRMATYNCYVNEKFGLTYGKDFVVLSKGDDFSVLYKEYISNDLIRQIYNTYFLKKPDKDFEICDTRSYGIGQICKFLDIGKPNSFKFCSLRSWYIDDDYHITLTRDPSKLYNLSQYSIKAKSYTLQELLSYHMDLALSYSINYPGIDVFDTIKRAHYQKAADICNHLNLKIVNRTLQNAKGQVIYNNHTVAHQSIIAHVCDDDFEEWYNVKHKMNRMKIDKDYWTTYSRIEKTRNDHLDSDQIKMVNYQINNEFNVELLQVLLALGKN